MRHNGSVEYLISDKNTFDDILSFMTSVDGDFIPSLFQRIDIKEYIDKILTRATIITSIRDKKMIGMIVFYDNDLVSKEAYITYLAVDGSWRKHGIASLLLENASYTAKKKGMKSISVSTCNPKVVSFYQNHEFITSKTEYDVFANMDRFYLQKKL